MSDKETGASAGGLLSYLQEAFGSRKKKPTEAPAVKAATPTVAQTETPAEFTAPPEPTLTMMSPGLTVTETPAPAARDELPDWLSASSPAESASAPLPEASEAQVVETPAVTVEAPMPAPEAPPALPEAGAPAFPREAEVEADPFATSREFNVYMETIRQAQEVLANGIGLNPEEKRKALIAVASSNSLLPKLPPEVFKSVLLMRAVASGNPKFGRDDFQLEMLAAMKAIRTGLAVRE